MTGQNQGLISHNEKLNKFTRQCLEEALLLLLEKKSLQEISVSELCAKAGVSRMTFYSRYKTKENLFEQIIRTLNKDFINAVGSPFVQNADPRLVQKIFRHNKAECRRNQTCVHYRQIPLSVGNKRRSTCQCAPHGGTAQRASYVDGRHGKRRNILVRFRLAPFRRGNGVFVLRKACRSCLRLNLYLFQKGVTSQFPFHCVVIGKKFRHFLPKISFVPVTAEMHEGMSDKILLQFFGKLTYAVVQHYRFFARVGTAHPRSAEAFELYAGGTTGNFAAEMRHVHRNVLLGKPLDKGAQRLKTLIFVALSLRQIHRAAVHVAFAARGAFYFQRFAAYKTFSAAEHIRHIRSRRAAPFLFFGQAVRSDACGGVYPFPSAFHYFLYFRQGKALMCGDKNLPTRNLYAHNSFRSAFHSHFHASFVPRLTCRILPAAAFSGLLLPYFPLFLILCQK